LLCDNPNTQLSEVYAAMALMCFHASRIESRISSEGEIILLAQQDRSKWNWKLIEEGNAYLNKAAFGDSLNTYHVEATIAFEHCVAISFEKTNWQQILAHYDLLVQMHPTAIVALNRLTVVYKINGAEETLKELNQSPYLKEWEKQYLYYSLLGEIYTQTDKRKAIANFEKAITLTHSEAERKLLKKKMEEL
jgi:RNA polymerase sigma-70 factor (ECF subfamily)